MHGLIKQAMKQEVSKLDEYELQRFFAQLERDPRGAISELMKGQMGVVGKEDIEKMIGDAIDQSFTSYDKYNQTRSVQRQRHHCSKDESAFCALRS